MKVIDALVDFAIRAKWEEFSPEVQQTVKNIMLDGVGDILSGLASDKGKIGIEMAKLIGGNPQSSVFGVGLKTSAPTAAFANSELINGLDFDPIPHLSIIILPAILAVAEAEHSSGEELLTALAVGAEVAFRLMSCLSTAVIIAASKLGKNPDIFGSNFECIIGAALANAMLMKLDREEMKQAIAIAAYYCPIPTSGDWESTLPKSLIKYVPASRIAQSSVEAAMLARFGYTGNTETLDREYGFPLILSRNKEAWDPQRVTNGLGQFWLIEHLEFKKYPCCRFLHTALDAFYKLKEEYRLTQYDIREIRCNISSFNAHPDQYCVTNQVDAQFSGPYSFAVAACGFEPGPVWQDKTVLENAEVRSFMPKVKMVVDPRFKEYKEKDRDSWYGGVEIDLEDGRTLTAEELYPKGTRKNPFSEEENKERFRRLSRVVLPDNKIENAYRLLINLQDQENLEELIDNVTL